MKTTSPHALPDSSKFIRNFVYLINGFTQTLGEDTGMMRLWARLFRLRASNPNLAATFLMPREWNDSTSEMVQLLERHATVTSSPRVVIAGYSWGAGHGAIRLAQALQEKGRHVDLMLLIDPVYRSRLPLAFRLLAFTNLFDITVPANVRRVAVWRQHNAGPRGTRITPADPKETTVAVDADLSSLGLTHATIQFHQPVLDRCTQLTQQTIEPFCRQPHRSRRACSRGADLSTVQ